MQRTSTESDRAQRWLGSCGSTALRLRTFNTRTRNCQHLCKIFVRCGSLPDSPASCAQQDVSLLRRARPSRCTNTLADGFGTVSQIRCKSCFFKPTLTAHLLAVPGTKRDSNRNTIRREQDLGLRMRVFRGDAVAGQIDHASRIGCSRESPYLAQSARTFG